MASTSTSPESKNNQCNGSNCEKKDKPVYRCTCCKKQFCIQHMDTHHDDLDARIEKITETVEQMKQHVDTGAKQSRYKKIEEEIEEWKTTSIKRIEDQAKKLKDELKHSCDILKNDLSETLEKFRKNMKKMRHENTFVETDSEAWKKQLNDVATNTFLPLDLQVVRYTDSLFVEKLTHRIFKIRNELFNRVSNDKVQIEENGHLAVHRNGDGCTEIRGKNEYTKGCHEICLSIDKVSNSWMFIGINSKSTLLQNESYYSKTAYGWSNDNSVWENGENKPNSSINRINMIEGDIIKLMLDCDNRLIQMYVKSTDKIHRLKILDGQCPFPWQIHVNLCGKNSSIRLLFNTSPFEQQT